MKNYFFYVGLCLILCACSTSKIRDKQPRYFDEYGKEISRSLFKSRRSTNEFLDIPGDSIHHKILIQREKKGTLLNRESFLSSLERNTNLEIDREKPVVIIYYPGKDSYNSSISISSNARIEWFADLERGINDIVQTKPIYIYKDSDGLEIYDGIIDWYQDPNGMVEKTFFNYYYPSQSFAVISTKGDYISYFGEFPKSYVWTAIESLMD